MRILHLIPSLQKGGAERLCLDIVQAQNQLPGTESRLAIMHAENEYASEYPGIKPLCLNSKVIPSLRKSWTVHTQEWDALLNEFKPDVIHSHLFEAEMLSRYQVRPGIRYISHCHDNMHPLKNLSVFEWTSKKRLTEAYERRFLLKQYKACQNTFIAISPDTYQYFRNELPKVLAPRVQFLPNAIQSARFTKNSAKFSGEKIRMINIGSFTPKKNQAFLLEVLLELNKKNVPCELVLAGSGALIESVKEASQRKGLESQLRFLGKTAGIESQLWNAQLYVHSASYEPFGLVLLEAMAAGLPVVSLDGKGNRDLVTNGVNGYMIPNADATEFADKIINCTKSHEVWEKMSAGAKQFASEYDINPYVQKLAVIYETK